MYKLIERKKNRQKERKKCRLTKICGGKRKVHQQESVSRQTHTTRQVSINSVNRVVFSFCTLFALSFKATRMEINRSQYLIFVLLSWFFVALSLLGS